MKYSIAIALVLLSNLLLAQDYPDLIIKENGDTLKCKITFVNDQNIFYNYKHKKSEKSAYISLGEVSNYSNEGIVSKPDLKILPKSENPVSSMPSSSAGDELMKTTDIMNIGFVFQGIGLAAAGMSLTVGTDGNAMKTLGYTSIGASLVGTVLIIVGVQHIGKAGRLMSSRVTFSGSGFIIRI